MEISVRHVNKYANVFVEDCGALIETGLLDTVEREDLAIEMLKAAIELLCDDRPGAAGDINDLIERMRIGKR